MVNLAIIVGNLGKDPELKYLESGQAVCNFSVATSEKWKDKDGNGQQRTEWHRINVWGKQAEACGKYLKKGSKVYLEGKIKTREWEKDGQKHYATEIHALDVKFLSEKAVADDGGGVPNDL